MDPIVDAFGSSNDSKSDEIAAMFSTLFKQEMSKYIRSKGVEEHANYANTADFAGTTFDLRSFSLSSGSWILDTGTSSHMCFNTNLLQHLQSLSPPTKIHLLDSSNKLISTHGRVTLHPQFSLSHVLFVPDFRFNLISVNKLLQETNLSLTFNKTCCIIQDLKSKRITTVAAVKGNLYILDKKSVTTDVMKHYMSDYANDTTCNIVNGNEQSTFL